jgi:Tol biopolymer transport system component
MSHDRPDGDELRRRLDRLAAGAPGSHERRDQTLSRAHRRARLGMTTVGAGLVAVSLVATLAVGAIRDLHRERPIGPAPTGTVDHEPGGSDDTMIRARGDIGVWGTGPAGRGPNLSIVAADGRGGPDRTAVGSFPTDRLSWSPDGTSVIVARRVNDAESTLEIMNARTGASTTMRPSGAPQTPDWSVTGRIVFATENGSLLTMPSGGGPTTTVRPGLHGSWPTWSPDGDQIAFITPTGHLAVVGARGSAPPQRIPGPAHPGSLDWSESGIAVSARPGAEAALFLVDPSTGGSRPLATDLPGNETSPTMSPDGRFVAFLNDGVDGAGGGLYVVAIDRGRPLLVDDGDRSDAALAWKPVS